MQSTATSALSLQLQFSLATVGKSMYNVSAVTGDEEASVTICETISELLNGVASALNTIRVWRHRTPRLPLSIESTAQLAESILMDVVATLSSNEGNNNSGGAPVRSGNELRSGYAMAILRGVNGLLLGIFPSSVSRMIFPNKLSSAWA